MKKKHSPILHKIIAIAAILLLVSCVKLMDFDQKPELGSLQQGLRTSAAIGYCISVATAVNKGAVLPENVSVDENTGLIHIKIDQGHPMLFNKNIGDIVMACHWGINGGVMSVLFGNLDILGGNVKLYGLYLVPFTKQIDQEDITAIFVKQDIILGNGSDTILDLSNITNPVFNYKMECLNSNRPEDVFVAVKQNVWFININPNGTYSDVYDDNITINGGGQIAEVQGVSGGIVYHALIDTRINYLMCTKNPISGYALSQNFKAGGIPFLDLGNSYISFRGSCDGMAHVELCTGKYFRYNNKDIPLGL